MHKAVITQSYLKIIQNPIGLESNFVPSKFLYFVPREAVFNDN